MPRKRALTDAQCRALAQWADMLDQLGTRQDKCRELGVNIQTLRDAIKRGRGQTDKHTRLKLKRWEIEQLAMEALTNSIVPRETSTDSEITTEEAAA